MGVGLNMPRGTEMLGFCHSVFSVNGTGFSSHLDTAVRHGMGLCGTEAVSNSRRSVQFLAVRANSTAFWLSTAQQNGGDQYGTEYGTEGSERDGARYGWVAVFKRACSRQNGPSGNKFTSTLMRTRLNASLLCLASSRIPLNEDENLMRKYVS